MWKLRQFLITQNIIIFSIIILLCSVSLWKRKPKSPLFAVDIKLASLESNEVDGIICVIPDFEQAPNVLKNKLLEVKNIDNAFQSHVSVLAVNLPAKRLIVSPVNTSTDYDDVRSFAEAAGAGIKRALAAGVQAPLLVLPGSEKYENTELVTLLGALEALYVPIQLREKSKPLKEKVRALYVTSESGKNLSDIVDLASTLEAGRVIARDIGGGDPERMAPPLVEQYVEEVFKDVNNVKIEVIKAEEEFNQHYPLFAAVNRGASVIERHRGRIIYMRYEPTSEVKKTLYLVGKGITYDTGGCDIKINGNMLGMSRDKCGAAAVAGFMKIVSLVKPESLRVVGALCLARNSVGENSYVSDEVIEARSGARVRVINTDAEGRMVMADVLCKLKEEAVNEKDAQLLTIATLTGHAVLTAGPYSIVIDNSVAFSAGAGKSIQTAGETLGDPFEFSRMRREDFAHQAGKQEGDDVNQSGNQPSSRSQRGHQGPAAFLVLASGLDKHGLKSEKPLKFCHLDIAGAAGEPPKEPTAAPLLALYGAFLR